MNIESIVTGAVMSATAVTGGVSAEGSQTVVTGDSSASVHVTNVINAGNGGGTSHTEIIKSIDGETTKEVVDKTYAPGEPVIVETVVEAVSREEKETTAAPTSVEEQAKSETEASVAAVVSADDPGHSETFLGRIAGILRSLLDFFWS